MLKNCSLWSKNKQKLMVGFAIAGAAVHAIGPH